MLKFSFPNLFIDNLSLVNNYYIADSNTNISNIFRGEKYKGYLRSSGTYQFIYNDFIFNTNVDYDHYIIGRADLLEAQGNLNSVYTMSYSGAVWDVDIRVYSPFSYSDIYNKDILGLKTSPLSYINNRVRLVFLYNSSASRTYAISKFYLGTFFEFDYNPSKWSYRTESNQLKFITDANTQLTTEIDYPKRTWTGHWENVTDVQLATFKSRVQQQLTDNQYAYCYLYDSSGRKELLGADLAHVRIEEFKYKKIQSNYNEIECKFVEVRG